MVEMLESYHTVLKQRTLLLCWRLQSVICIMVKPVRFGRNPYQKSSGACQICSVQKTLDIDIDFLEHWPVGQGLQEASGSCAGAEQFHVLMAACESWMNLQLTVWERFYCSAEQLKKMQCLRHHFFLALHVFGCFYCVCIQISKAVFVSRLIQGSPLLS